MAAALADVLKAAAGGTVPVHAAPPATFNPPALIVQYPTRVAKHTPVFALDQAELSVLAAAGVGDPDTLDSLLSTATAAIETNPSLTGAVQIAKPVEWRTWRILTVSGVDMFTAELALEIRM
jgi:hypothetical protein